MSRRTSTSSMPPKHSTSTNGKPGTNSSVHLDASHSTSTLTTSSMIENTAGLNDYRINLSSNYRFVPRVSETSNASDLPSINNSAENEPDGEEWASAEEYEPKAETRMTVEKVNERIEYGRKEKIEMWKKMAAVTLNEEGGGGGGRIDDGEKTKKVGGRKRKTMEEIGNVKGGKKPRVKKEEDGGN